ncbi:MAG: hypothetical protein C3F12_04465 [Candidatus Methylomirabilota bacterium]|nr:SOS response-associated peptidase [candidate division NC10 bacterium]PWB47235.1 MAG: hypothetical protein C3F12_04465 [candidate division NC10 bacterium]
MCGRFTLTTTLDTAALRFKVRTGLEEADYKPRYNIAPTQAVIVVGDDEQRYLTRMRWGLVPSWAKDPAIGNRMINARAETVATKRAFRAALRKRRCLVVADGFYEWQKRDRTKQPFRIVLKNGEPFGFAGLWDTWRSPEGEEVKSCTIITVDANELLRPIHDRMPAILTREAEAVWLDPAIQEPARLLPLLTPYPSDEMECHAVDAWVNNPAHETPACVAPRKDYPPNRT